MRKLYAQAKTFSTCKDTTLAQFTLPRANLQLFVSTSCATYTICSAFILNTSLEALLVDTFTFSDKWDINRSLIFEYLSTLGIFLDAAAKTFGATGWVVKHFNRAVVKSFLIFSVTACYGNLITQERKQLDEAEFTTSKIIGCHPHS